MIRGHLHLQSRWSTLEPGTRYWRRVPNITTMNLGWKCGHNVLDKVHVANYFQMWWKVAWSSELKSRDSVDMFNVLIRHGDIVVELIRV